MDLVTCPKCRFVFSPDAGKSAKCPACMTVIARGMPAARIQSRPSERKVVAEPVDHHEPGPGRLVALAGGAVGLLLVISLGVFLTSRNRVAGPGAPSAVDSPSPTIQAKVGATPPPPSVFVPKSSLPISVKPPEPTATTPATTPEKPANALEPFGEGSTPKTPAKSPLKVRPLDVPAVPEIALAPPR